MAILKSEHILRKSAFEMLKHSRETGESVILTRDGKPEIIMLTFDAYVRLRAGEDEGPSESDLQALEQQAVDTTVCLRNCPFRTPRPGSIQRKP